MARVLLDTNILVYLGSPATPMGQKCQNVVDKMLKQGDQPMVCAQTIREFWVVASRPTEVNGLGWPPSLVRKAVDQFRMDFEMLGDSPAALGLWLELVTLHELKGKRVHDAYLVALMKANGVERILTSNAGDFPASHGIVAMIPE